jgi:phosphoribosylformimino-5-aminoimidazole carboxamide ribotide isomerase
VDLDAARTGEPVNRALVGAIAAAVAPDGVRVQSGGGVRDRAGARALWAAGVSRVVVGTAAVEDPALVAALASERPDGVAVGIDARQGEVVVRGWLEGSGQRAADVLGRLGGIGVSAVVVTDVARDGMLMGPDATGLTSVLAGAPPGVDVIASGGVATVEDLALLAGVSVGGRRLAGVIVGKALYEGRFSVSEGVAACAVSA